PAWLPPALESPSMSGVTADGVPVAAGAGDQAAGALGVGVDRPGPVSVVLGTSGVVFAALEEFAADPGARVHAFCHAVPGAWHVMGVMLSADDSLRWLGRQPVLARVSGGGARSDLWLQIVASVLELPLERVAVDEGAAFGAAILGGVAAGVWDDVHAAVAATVRVRDAIEPVPEWVEVY